MSPPRRAAAARHGEVVWGHRPVASGRCPAQQLIQNGAPAPGRRVSITGGTQGTGAALVRPFAAAGAVTVTSTRSRLPEGPGPHLFVQADLTTPEGGYTLAQTAVRELGGVDLLIHKLGGSTAPGGGFAALTDERGASHLVDPAAHAAARVEHRLCRGESGAVGLLEGALERARAARRGVNAIAPGWIRTTAADAMVQRLAASPECGEAAQGRGPSRPPASRGPEFVLDGCLGRRMSSIVDKCIASRYMERDSRFAAPAPRPRRVAAQLTLAEATGRLA